MLRNLLYFLGGCLVIVIVVYICHMMLGLIGLPPDIAQFAVVILALGALVAVIYLAYRIFSGTPLP